MTDSPTISADASEGTAICRHCGRALDGRPYRFGGSARIPETGERAKKNYYGGYVCSQRCDFNASLELEQSMPGHGIRQRRLGCYAQKAYEQNWDINS